MSGNSMSTLSSRLSERLKSDQQAVQNQTTELLKVHAEALKELSSDALATTLIAINETAEKHQQWLQKWAESQRRTVSSASTDLKKLLRLPLLASLILSAAMILGAAGWSWWKVQSTQEQMRLEMTRAFVQFCATPAGKYSAYCKG